MAQHFLRSPQARDLTITELASMQERTAKKLFRQARWPETLAAGQGTHHRAKRR
jgi:hypothetical protein